MNEDIKILVVDDEEIFTSILKYLLSPIYTVFVANSGQMAIKMVKEIMPDLILLDGILPDISGFDVFAEIKKCEATHDIPVIFITGLNNIEEEERGFFLGARDYITKPFVNSIVLARVRTHVQIISQIRTIEQKCMIDALTNLPNRRSFDERFKLEWDRSLRDISPISLLFIDMDRFKHYNDTYGHPFGDMLIQKSGEIYQKTLKRGTDFVSRWGGDEFAILLPNTDFEGACEVARKIGHNISSQVINCPNGETISATISVGVNTTTPLPADESADFMEKTDKALYAAKESGRNRFCTYEDYLRQQASPPQENTAKAEEPAVSVLPKPVKAVSADNKSTSEPLSAIDRVKIIKGLEVDRAIASIGGSEALYSSIFSIVINSIPQNIKQLDKSLFDDHDLRLFTIKIHGMKGSLKQIGHNELSKLAEALENESRAENESYCLQKYPAFKKSLTVFYERANNLDNNIPASTTQQKDAGENDADTDVESSDKSKIILVIDDNVANLTLIKALLSKLYTVIAVNSGESALRFLKKQVPNLILLDVEMPNMGGKEVFKTMQSDSRLADIPVIFLTGLTDMESEAEAFTLGVSDYIQKPVNDVIMLHRVKMQLELQELRGKNDSE